jgi:phage terminase large subunit GpA-like protein
VPARLRTLREFAEQEITIPDGQYRGLKFRCDRQPYVGRLYDEIDSGRWSRVVCTGPTQSGKTLCAFVIIAMYHLFEIGETVILACPDMQMARDKWMCDLLPAIRSSRYAHLLPEKGTGSGGGFGATIPFQNGVVLRWMTGGGGDKSRSAFSSRVVIVTETDGMDSIGGKSRESDKITQIIARTDAYGDRARIYMECTVSVEEGRTWQEYTSGSHSRLMLKCPHCGDLVDMTRDTLTGWKGVDDEHTARNDSAFGCPACGALWSEDDRRRANNESVLVHDGQEVNGADVTGQGKRTNTLGFRWTAAHNMFQTAGHIGWREWKASRSHDEDNAEREMRQYVWALPYIPPKADLTKLLYDQISRRAVSIPKGDLPDDTERLTVGIDLGLYRSWYVTLAHKTDGSPHVVDYGQLPVSSSELGEDVALGVMLREFADVCETGWQGRSPDAVFIDSGWLSHVVYDFVRKSGVPYYAVKGQGEATTRKYTEPRSPAEARPFVGSGYSVVKQDAEQLWLVEINADQWKSWVHARLATPIDKTGALTLYEAAPVKHYQFGKHLTAETRKEEFVAGKGTVIKWERTRKDNHYLDALYMAACAGHLTGVRLASMRTETKQTDATPAVAVSGNQRRAHIRPRRKLH